MKKPTPKLTSIYINSHGVDTIPKQVNGVWKQVITARVNQTAYELVCNELLEVPPEVAEVLRPVLERKIN